jgi:hypothetical protein
MLQWAMLQGLAPDTELQEAAFQRLWSLKEVRSCEPVGRRRHIFLSEVL